MANDIVKLFNLPKSVIKDFTSRYWKETTEANRPQIAHNLWQSILHHCFRMEDYSSFKVQLIHQRLCKTPTSSMARFPQVLLSVLSSTIIWLLGITSGSWTTDCGCPWSILSTPCPPSSSSDVSGHDLGSRITDRISVSTFPKKVPEHCYGRPA